MGKSTFILEAACVTLFFGALVVAQNSGQTLDCTHYTGANTTSATCNEDPHRVCTGGCTGGVVIRGCTLLHQHAAPSEQKCTISFGKSGANLSVCMNEQGTFDCTGVPTGSATCSGCMDSTATGNSSTSDTSSSGGYDNPNTDGPLSQPDAKGPDANNTSGLTDDNQHTPPHSGAKPISFSREVAVLLILISACALVH